MLKIRVTAKVSWGGFVLVFLNLCLNLRWLSKSCTSSSYLVLAFQRLDQSTNLILNSAWAFGRNEPWQNFAFVSHPGRVSSRAYQRMTLAALEKEYSGTSGRPVKYSGYGPSLESYSMSFKPFNTVLWSSEQVGAHPSGNEKSSRSPDNLPFFRRFFSRKMLFKDALPSILSPLHETLFSALRLVGHPRENPFHRMRELLNIDGLCASQKFLNCIGPVQVAAVFSVGSAAAFCIALAKGLGPAWATEKYNMLKGRMIKFARGGVGKRNIGHVSERRSAQIEIATEKNSGAIIPFSGNVGNKEVLRTGSLGVPSGKKTMRSDSKLKRADSERKTKLTKNNKSSSFSAVESSGNKSKLLSLKKKFNK